MGSKLLFLSALLGCTVLPASAQITITEEDLQGQYEERLTASSYVTESADGLQAIVDAEGANQTWDFSAISFELLSTATSEAVEPPVPGSDDPDLSQANLIWRSFLGTEAEEDSTAYSYFLLNDTTFTFLGVVSAGEFDDVPGADTSGIKYRPGNELWQLPLTYGATWSNTYNLEFWPTPSPFTSTTTDENEVDGWGTLVTPTGSEAALRIYTRSITTTEIPGLPVSTDTSYTITFITEGETSASIALDQDGQALGASYSVLSDQGVPTEPGVELPSRVTLGQNYPNPFNPQTTIPFSLEQAGSVRMEVYDALGRKVATLLDEVRSAGEHEVEWAAEGLPSGVYLCRVTSNDVTITRMLTLQK